jgi:riboflavin synthase|tara:strand:- start:751 stop:1341 length:591 start_codon:yes stop_codon:yes gene_type:complete
MFTGIIQAIGNISKIDSNGPDSRIVFKAGKMKLDDVKIGDSISVNGVCLSITEKTKDSFSSDLSSETLSLTTFIEMRANSKVNLEKAMNFSSRVNGHLIAGHVDGVGVIKEMKNDGRSILILIEFPEELEKYISKKGSIAVDGVSLTINGTKENTFSINIIPHTLSGSIISEYNIGTKVNIEVDLIARYLEKLVVK